MCLVELYHGVYAGGTAGVSPKAKTLQTTNATRAVEEGEI
jgi:hypothetical protein